MITNAASPRLVVRGEALRPALLHGGAIALACLVSYLITTRALAAVHSVSTADDKLGGMWAVVATVFVYRLGYRDSLSAAASRSLATVLSFALCLVYLLLFPFNPLGLAALIGIGTAVLMLGGREGDVVTTAITTAVVLVVAALAPTDAWEQPILRAVDTGAGIAVGLAAAWFAHFVDSSRSRRHPGSLPKVDQRLCSWFRDARDHNG
jgi:uncharacterized membrane protein YccC